MAQQRQIEGKSLANPDEAALAWIVDWLRCAGGYLRDRPDPSAGDYTKLRNDGIAPNLVAKKAEDFPFGGEGGRLDERFGELIEEWERIAGLDDLSEPLDL